MGERGGGGLAQGRFGEADVSRQDETKKGELLLVMYSVLHNPCPITYL